VIVAVVVAYLFLSGFLSNPTGPLGYFQAFTPWMKRAGGTDIHNHPWNYYLSILAWNHRGRGPIWTEGLILLLALAGGISVFRLNGSSNGADPHFLRFAAIYTVLLTVIYSAIPYKTPWCVLSFLSGIILLAGVGADFLFRKSPGTVAKTALVFVFLAGSGQLAWQAYRTSFIYQTDGRNPYVYAQPAPDIAELGKRVDELSRVHPQHEAMVVKVISTDEYYWPLPWYLRELKNVGYWTQVPDDSMAPVVIASPEFDEALTKKLDPTHLMTGYFGLRPGVMFEVWVKMDLWTEFINRRSKPRKDASGLAAKI
jgi:predicted membrane-bound mannosyltransferase